MRFRVGLEFKTFTLHLGEILTSQLSHVSQYDREISYLACRKVLPNFWWRGQLSVVLVANKPRAPAYASMRETLTGVAGFKPSWRAADAVKP